VDLRVYATGGNPSQAAAVAQTAVAEGAAVILGPVYAEEANAAGVAVAPSGRQRAGVLQQPDHRGGQRLPLGPTFRNTADRLIRYGRGVGIDRYLVAYATTWAAPSGATPSRRRRRPTGPRSGAPRSTACPSRGIQEAAPRIAAAAQAAGAQAVFTTAGPTPTCPILATALPEAGCRPRRRGSWGLTRWDTAPQILALPGLQGGLFAIPTRASPAVREPLPAGLWRGAASARGRWPSTGSPPSARCGAGPAGGLSRAALTQGQGFQGTAGIFRSCATAPTSAALRWPPCGTTRW
jgi:hypothetical protein